MLGCFAGILLGVFIILFLPKEYRVMASLKVEPTSSSIAENLFENLTLVEQKLSTADEMVKLKSFDLVSDALAAIDYRVTYYEKGLVFYNQEVQGKPPFRITVDTTEIQLVDCPIKIQWISDSIARVKADLSKGYLVDFRSKKQTGQEATGELDETVRVGEKVKSNYFDFTLDRVQGAFINPEAEYKFRIEDPSILTEKYIQTLNINPAIKDASILQLKLKTKNPERDINFLDQLIRIYIR